ncbi:MAG: CBS domain-containing protein [Candidatus Omnitrophica bacterium]|nr:CBS domain-containing protein [Candidatus Omnitrophota bacterium]
MKDIISKIKVKEDLSIKEALKLIDETGRRILFICNGDGSLLGSLTDGDIRRRVLKTGDLKEKITTCFNRTPIFILDGNNNTEEAKRIMLEKSIDIIPVVDKKKNILEVFFYSDIFGKENSYYTKTDVPVVIMAGGKGDRLDPFTKILPKPLIPIGEKPIIEIIIEKFRRQGVERFYVTLNYKGEMVKNYFDSIEKDYTIEYTWEEEFLGTAGSLKLLPQTIKDTFIVSNCDIIVDADYADLVKFHKKNNNLLTVVGSIQHHKMPYGIIHYKEEGKISQIHEKPEFDFTVNTGAYVLSKDAISHMPEEKHFDMTDFINVLLEKKENVGVYPVSQRSYVDIGQWEEYKKYTDKLI